MESQLQAATALHREGDLERAAQIYRELLAAAPDDFRLNHLLGALRCQQGRSREAVQLLEHALRLRPMSAPTLICFGVALAADGRADEGEEALRFALHLESSSEEAWTALGSVLTARGRTEEAIGALERAVELKPDYAYGWTLLGSALLLVGRGSDAVVAHTRALTLDPQQPRAHFARAEALQACHCVEEAIADLDAQLALRPSDFAALSSRLFLLNFLDEMTREELAREHFRYGRAVDAAAVRVHRTPPPAETGEARLAASRIHVGFLSPDFRTHPVAWFIEPFLAHFDREQFEVTLYHDHPAVDPVTNRLKGLATRWRHIAGQSNEAVERLVRADRPDIMVDLAGHTGFNRLEIFGRRLAPLQVSYLGYPNTTGLTAMDCRLTDPVADPFGMTDSLHAEKLVRFASVAWAYTPPSVPPPAGPAGPLTFGSFNSLSKVNLATLRLWSRVLAAVPRSRLVLKSGGLVAARWQKRLLRAGFDLQRVELRASCPSADEHLAAYGAIDVALDPFPYNGTTTTCEALAMGVPVVTLAGDRHCGRVGASLLTAIGRTEWIAQSPDEYVRIAAEAAAWARGGSGRRAEVRESLRASALCDAAGQSRRFWAALRNEWLARPGAEAVSGQNLPTHFDAAAAAEAHALIAG